MRSTEHMKRHLWVDSYRDGERIGSVAVEDPFHRTRVVIEWSVWDLLKLIFRRRRETEVVVRVRADGVAHMRWFNGVDVCERCEFQRLTDAYKTTDVPNEFVCESCYHGCAKPPPVASATDGTNAEMAKGQ